MRPDDFLPLGDASRRFPNGYPSPLPLPDQILMVAPGTDPNALRHPTGFTWVLNDEGSGSPNPVEYWWPNAPPGYRTLGMCWTSGGPPSEENYWCVADAYCVASDTELFWSDGGQHWDHHTGNLLIASTPPGRGQIAAGSYLSQAQVNDSDGAIKAYLLQLGSQGWDSPG
jgi:hypothetical protein